MRIGSIRKYRLYFRAYPHRHLRLRFRGIGRQNPHRCDLGRLPKDFQDNRAEGSRSFQLISNFNPSE